MEEQIKLNQPPTEEKLSIFIRMQSRNYHHLFCAELDETFRLIAEKVSEFEKSKIEIIVNSLLFQIQHYKKNLQTAKQNVRFEIPKDEMNLLELMLRKVAMRLSRLNNISNIYLDCIIDKDRSLEYVFGFNFMKNP